MSKLIKLIFVLFLCTLIYFVFFKNHFNNPSIANFKKKITKIHSSNNNHKKNKHVQLANNKDIKPIENKNLKHAQPALRNDHQRTPQQFTAQNDRLKNNSDKDPYYQDGQQENINADLTNEDRKDIDPDLRADYEDKENGDLENETDLNQNVDKTDDDLDEIDSEPRYGQNNDTLSNPQHDDREEVETDSLENDIRNETNKDNNNYDDDISQIDNTEQIKKIKGKKLKHKPHSLINDNYICYHNDVKVPVWLQWTPVKEATHYEIEIYRNAKKRTQTFWNRAKSNKHIMIYPNARYKWRIRAYKRSKVISEFSDNNPLYVKGPTGDHTTSKFENNFKDHSNNYIKVTHYGPRNPQPLMSMQKETITDPDLTSDVDSSQDTANDDYSADIAVDDIAEDTDSITDVAPDSDIDPYADDDYGLGIDNEDSKSENFSSYPTAESAERSISSLPPPRNLPDFWFKAGTGINSIDYLQKIEDTANLEHNSIEAPNIFGSIGYKFNYKNAIQMNYVQSPGKLVDESNNVDKSFTWQNFSIEGIYKFNAKKPQDGQAKNINWEFYSKYGLNYHKIPLMQVFNSGLDIKINENTFYKASLALGANKQFSNNTTLDISLRYQHPFKADSTNSDYSLTSGYMLDSFIEYGYKFNKNVGINAFLNSQLFNSEYEIKDGNDSAIGTQRLINNILGVNLSYEID